MNSILFLQYGPHDNSVSYFPYAILWIHQLPEYTQVLFLILMDAPLAQFFMILQGKAGAIDVSNFLRAFFMVSLNSVSSGSMKEIPRNFRAFSRWSFSSVHFCFSFSLASFLIDFQSCPQMTWPGCKLFSRQSLTGPHLSIWRFFFQSSILSETSPRTKQVSWPSIFQ